jgi:hypothetical protein
MDFTTQQASMFTYLVEILCFFIRQHHTFSKEFVLKHGIARRVAQLLKCREKYLKLGKASTDSPFKLIKTDELQLQSASSVV